MIKSIVIASAILAASGAAQAQDMPSTGSKYIGAENCTLKLQQVVYDVFADPTVKVAKTGDSVYLEGLLTSVYIWCDSGSFHYSRTKRDAESQAVDSN